MQAQEEYEISEMLKKITISDVLDELTDAEDTLALAVKSNDAAAIGRIFLAVRAAYAERLVVREMYEKGVKMLTTPQVAAMAFYGSVA
jgi:hypothetical protein